MRAGPPKRGRVVQCRPKRAPWRACRGAQQLVGRLRARGARTSTSPSRGSVDPRNAASIRHAAPRRPRTRAPSRSRAGSPPCIARASPPRVGRQPPHVGRYHAPRHAAVMGRIGKRSYPDAPSNPQERGRLRARHAMPTRLIPAAELRDPRRESGGRLFRRLVDGPAVPDRGRPLPPVPRSKARDVAALGNVPE